MGEKDGVGINSVCVMVFVGVKDEVGIISDCVLVGVVVNENGVSLRV